jgi:hypothetical protein
MYYSNSRAKEIAERFASTIFIDPMHAQMLKELGEKKNSRADPSDEAKLEFSKSIAERTGEARALLAGIDSDFAAQCGDLTAKSQRIFSELAVKKCEVLAKLEELETAKKELHELKKEYRKKKSEMQKAQLS